ncbi:MAG: ComEC/Rec2 family competence protein [Oscillospiraceae bacterium]|nr:ComEC/Rec2 family competence protein [Oscillospiraceae bacterium]
MKRPALYIGLPYIMGLLIASRLDILSWSVILLTAFGIILYRRSVWKYVVLSTLSCLIACCCYWHHDSMTAQKQKDFAGLEILFTGQVMQKTAYPSGNADYLLKGRINRGDTLANIELFIDDDSFNYGDILMVSGRPERITSDYLFDDESYSRAKNVFLCFDLYTEKEILEVRPLEKQTLVSIIYDWRTRMTERIQACMPSDTASMLTGMLFGDKTELRHSVKTSLYRTGIGHILAVSGLHLDFLAMCANWILEKLRAGRKSKFILSAILCGLFVICAGGTVSVKRACIMILISQSGKLFFRQADAFNSLSIAMLILGLENPFVIHSTAFWLSCSGAFGIGVVAQDMTKEFPDDEFYHLLLKDLIVFTWTFVIILPVSVRYFREFSLISPLTNLFLTPVCLVSILMGVFAIGFGCQGMMAEFFLHLADKLNSMILTISDFFAGMSWTHTSADSEILCFLLDAGMILVIGCHIMFRNKKLTSFSVVIALMVTGISVNLERISQADDLKIAILGEENQCLLAVRRGADAVLFDMTGDYYAPDYAEIYLESAGVSDLESLYLCNPKEKAIRRYEEYLAFFVPEEIWLMKETDFRMPSLPDCETYSAERKELLFHGAKIEISQKQIRIEYAEKIFICKNDKTEISETPDILTIYGKSKNIQPECGFLLILDKNELYLPDAHTYLDENNLEVTVSENGGCRVRRLYGTD